MATSRLAAGLVVATYMAVVARGIPESIMAFYGVDEPHAALYGYALYAGTITLSTLPALLFWVKSPRTRLITAPLLLLAWTLNPAGFGNPLQASGLLFHGWGWWGLAATLLLTTLPLLTRWALVLPLLALLLLPATPQQATPDWHTHNTHYTFGATPAVDYLADFQRHQTLQQSMTLPGKHLFPESVGGVWNPLLTAN
jgi:hypothetical protein